MNGINKEKKLLVNTVIFSIGSLGSKIVSFIIVPIYTMYMSQQEYGLADTMLVLATLLLPIISFSLPEAVLRFMLTKEKDGDLILFNSFLFVGITGIFFIIISLLLNFFITPKWIFYLSLFLFVQMYYALFSQYSKGKEKNILFSIMSIILSCMLLLFTYFFLRFIEDKVQAFFLSQILSYTITSILYFSLLRINKSVRFKNFDFEIIKSLLIYSAPLIPNQVMWWIMNASSRLFIIHFSGYAISGLYAVSSKIPSIINIFTTIFLQSWQISAIEELKSEDNSVFFSKITNNMFSLLSICISVILVVLKPLINIFVSANFYDSWKYVPFLLISLLFSSMSQLIGMSYIASMKTAGNFFTSVFGAIVNLVFNFILVPILGANGASIASAISFFIVFIIRLIDTRKFVKLQINKSKWSLNVLLIMLQIFLQFRGYLLPNFVILIFVLVINKNLIIQIFNISKKIVRKKI